MVTKSRQRDYLVMRMWGSSSAASCCCFRRSGSGEIAVGKPAPGVLFRSAPFPRHPAHDPRNGGGDGTQCGGDNALQNQALLDSPSLRHRKTSVHLRYICADANKGSKI